MNNGVIISLCEKRKQTKTLLGHLFGESSPLVHVSYISIDRRPCPSAPAAPWRKSQRLFPELAQHD